jgi:hypothetical protein
MFGGSPWNGDGAGCASRRARMPRRRSITIASTGAAGTWAAAVSGIERALVVLAPQTHVVVSSAPEIAGVYRNGRQDAETTALRSQDWLATAHLNLAAKCSTGSHRLVKSRFKP